MRFRITVRGDSIELRGYVDGPLEYVQDLASALQHLGMVVASPADPDYNPFVAPRD